MSKRIAILILAVALAGALAAPARAASDGRTTLNLKVGGSELVETTHPVKRATVANPDIADIVVLSPKEFYAYAKKVGYTSIILWEDENNNRTVLDLVVALDLTHLKQKLHDLFPNERIEVHSSETGVVLTGTVSGPEVMEEVLRLTRTYMPALAQGDKTGAQAATGTSGSGITNLLRVAEIQQVMLEVKFAEVSRESDKDWKAALGLFDLGNNMRFAAGTGKLGVTSGTLDQTSGSVLLNFAPAAGAIAGNISNIFLKAGDVSAALELLEREGLARTLAEPRLVTLSGQEASFLAGGEFPVPVAQEQGKITIEFKDFGVGLRFTPVVLSDGRINLRVAPTVSEIASASVIPAGILGADFIVPNLTTRKLETTVQLYDGQTLALAGLLQDTLREEVKKIPGLGDLPVLGALFRSSSFRQDKTDLLVAVTPRLVKPSKEGVRFPGDGLVLPDPYEFYLGGRLEGARSEGTQEGKAGVAVGLAPESKRGGLEGDFGHQEPL